MLSLLLVANTLILAQEPEAGGIPTWILILLGIILLIVIMGLVIGARTSERKSPTVRSTNVKEGTNTVPQQEPVRPEMIPQTGSDVLNRMATAEDGVQDVEGPISHDDLTAIHGITPVVAQILEDAGITTYEQLARTDPQTLKNMLRTVDVAYSDPETWPEQARLAEAGRFDELDRYRDRF